MSNTPPPTPPNVIPIGEGGTPVQMPGSTGGEGLFGTTGSHWPDPPPAPPPHVAPVMPHPVAVPAVPKIPMHAHPVWHAIGLAAKTVTLIGALGLGAAFGLPAIVPVISQAIGSISNSMNNTTPVVPASGSEVYLHFSLCKPGGPGWDTNGGRAAAPCSLPNVAATGTLSTDVGPDTQPYIDNCQQAIESAGPSARWNGTQGSWCSTDPAVTVVPSGVAGTDWWD
jgi:hypothetical protein